jgi:hypothetical protein
MLILDDLLLAPGKAMVALFEQLAKRAQDEFLDDAVVKQELHEIHSLLEGGQISETEFEGREGRLLERLEQIMKAKLQGGWGSDLSLSAPTDDTFAGIAAFARDLGSPAEDTEVFEEYPDPPAIDTFDLYQSGAPMVIDTLAIAEDPPEPPMQSKYGEELGRLFFAVADDPPPPPRAAVAVGQYPLARPVQAAPPPIEAVAFTPDVAPAIAYSYPPTPALEASAPAVPAFAPMVPTASLPPPVINTVPVQPAPPNVPPPDVPVRATMNQAADAAVRGLSMLKMRVSSITSVVPNGEGWQVTVELVERKSVPDTSDLLGVYEAFLDAAGNLLRYERTRIRRRCDIGG